MIDSNCPICKKKTNEKVELKFVVLFYCKKCKHRFTDKNLIKNPEKYQIKYFSTTHSNWFDNPDYVLFNTLSSFLKKNFSKKFSLLDIGCGNGNFLKYISKKINNISLTGIDHLKNKKNKKVRFLKGDIEKNKSLRKYDVVISNMVIEHIEDVGKFILIQKKLCKKNGYIINITINESSFLYKISRVLNFLKISKPMEMLYDKHHLNHFSVNSLKVLFKKKKMHGSIVKLSQFNIHALTLPSDNFFIKNFLKLLILIIYQIENFLRNTNQQTIIYKNTK
tara:strand:+ start:683 stop:1519 length:837 start_codon:yes stop_codon:yes gene_type:complete